MPGRLARCAAREEHVGSASHGGQTSADVAARGVKITRDFEVEGVLVSDPLGVVRRVEKRSGQPRTRASKDDLGSGKRQRAPARVGDGGHAKTTRVIGLGRCPDIRNRPEQSLAAAQPHHHSSSRGLQRTHVLHRALDPYEVHPVSLPRAAEPRELARSSQHSCKSVASWAPQHGDRTLPSGRASWEEWGIGVPAGAH